MRNFKKVYFILLIALVGFLSSCSDKQEIKKDPILVKTDKVQKSAFEKKISLVGEIEAYQSVDVYPKVAGNILSYELEDGSKVYENTLIKKDQVFAIIDHEDLEIQLKKAKSGLEIASANVHIAQLNLEEAKKDLLRMEKLFHGGSLSQKQMEMSVSNEKKAKALCQQAIANEKNASASYELAKKMLDSAFVKSPIDGVITKKYITENNQASIVKPIVQIANLSNLKIVVGIPEKIFPLIHKDTTFFEIKVDSYPKKSFNARIARIYPTIDKMSRMGTIELQIENNQVLKPGMYANIEMKLQKQEPIIKVPISSLIYHDGAYRAYIYKEGRAFLKKLSLGEKNDLFAEVLSGINEDDDLIIMGQNRLSDQIEVIAVKDNIEGLHEAH